MNNRGVAVEADHVVKRYGPINALQGASMSVAASEFVTIMGPSGSGKSTMLNMIGSLDHPDSGTITVGEKPVPDPRRAVEFRRRTVGFVFQDNLLLPYLSAQANVESALIATGLGRRERHARSVELLAEVGLENRAGTFPPSSPAASARRRRSHARSRTIRACCSPTSRPARSIPTAHGERSTCSHASATAAE